MNNAFVLFLKYPEKGYVKTRLEKILGRDLTFELYTCFIHDIIQSCKGVSADTIIFYTKNGRISEDDFFIQTGFPCFVQRGYDLGERMYNGFTDIFSRGYTRCVLIGSDCLEVDYRIINEAFEGLNYNDMVLGPTGDGGYYLIGFNKNAIDSDLFDNIPWSTSDVFRNTLKVIERKKISLALIKVFNDIDTVDDLRDFYSRYKNSDSMSNTLLLLKQNEGVLYEKI